MTKGRLRPLVRRVDPTNWQDELCAELVPVLRAMLEHGQLRVVEVGCANVKAAELVVRLDRRPSDGALAIARSACRRDEHLTLTAGGLGCRRHFAGIEWKCAAPADRTWWRILADALGVVPRTRKASG